jgi:carbon storage regulator
MLVLSRKKDEWIDIGGGISLVVVAIRGDKVRLGVKAPESVSVHRREVADKIRAALCTPGDKPPCPPASGSSS